MHNFHLSFFHDSHCATGSFRLISGPCHLKHKFLIVSEPAFQIERVVEAIRNNGQLIVGGNTLWDWHLVPLLPFDRVDQDTSFWKDLEGVMEDD